MKKIKSIFLKSVLPLICCALLAFLSSCTKEEKIKLYDLVVQLTYPESFASYSGVTVEIRNTSDAGVYKAVTDSQGKAFFQVPAGVYEAVTSDVREDGDFYYICNGVSSQIVVQKGETASFDIEVKVAKMNGRNPLIIKELYFGGVMNDNNSKAFHFDKCVILYNNSSKELSLNNLCIGIVGEYNAHSGSLDHVYNNGKLVYDGQGWLPASNGIWYFPTTLTLKPYSQIVVNIHGAIDNTQTVSRSINYANKDYYCMYDPDYVTADVSVASARSYNNTNYYPAPSDLIPTSHYLKTIKYGQSNAWSISSNSPAVIIFQPKNGASLSHFTAQSNYWYNPGYAASPVWRSVKVPNEWVMDGVEVWSSAYINSSKKRITADVDAGYITLTNQLGHVIYRNVDKESTEALPENKGKLVYNYSLGVDSSTDPSGIDAEASIKNGAHIIFMDTNNSSKDFHERQKCSLRGE